MRSFGRLSGLAPAALLCAACQLTPNFETGYELDRTPLRASPATGSLGVKRLNDARAPRSYGDTSLLFLLAIPLVPYLTFDYERLDESVRITSHEIQTYGPGTTRGAVQRPAGDFEDYTFPASFSRAIAADLGASGLFTQARYVGWTSDDADRYLLEGTLRESLLYQALTAYGLGPVGVVLTLTALPNSKTEVHVVVDAVLRDQRNGTVIWQATLDEEVSQIFNTYTTFMIYGREGAYSFTLPPPPEGWRVNDRSLFSWHFEALRRAMAKARPEIASALARYEASSPQ